MSSSSPLSSEPSPDVRDPPRPAKRSATASKPALKRARVSVGADETTQVTSLESFRLNLADADVFYVEDFIDRKLAQTWHDELCNIEGWYQPTLKMYGKEITQSRKIAAFATDPNLTVKYSGALVDLKYDYPPLLRKIQDLVEDKLGVKFNHCMMNRYENGQVYIGNHRDNRENRVIASLSLGAARTFIMEHDRPPADVPAAHRKPTKSKVSDPKRPKEPDPTTALSSPLYYKKWTLESGSLVVMQGDTQQKWKHQIPKEAKVKDSRISLTFRQLVF